MPSLARSVPKPLKVPSLARSVPKFLKCLVLHVLFFLVLIWDLFDFTWDLVSFLYVAGRSSHLRGPRREPACIDGWMDGWWMDGRAAEVEKITYFKNFSKTIQYFFLVVSRPLRRVLKTFSEKNSKKTKIFNFCKKFRTIFFFSDFFGFFIKKNIFLEQKSIFFPSCFASP